MSSVLDRMVDKAPWIVVDTGTLLTLMLGGEGQSGPGYTPLLVDIARRKLAHVAIPDMVVAEFIGTLAPLYKEDFVGSKAFIDSEGKNVPFGFAKAKERVAFIRQLLANDWVEITPTACGTEYLNRLRVLLAANPDYQRQKDLVWPPPAHLLRTQLCSPFTRLYKAVKNNALVDAQGHEVSSGKQDRGELAVADTIRAIHICHSEKQPVFALFEGSDVRGRIIQRLLSPQGSDAYTQLHGEVLPQFNPSGPQFDKEAAASLGNINFLSTKAFLAGFMKAAKELCVSQRVMGMERWYILHPDEARKNGYLNEGYQELMRQVNSHGLGRAYDKYRDRPITDMRPDSEDEYALVKNQPQNAPWMQQMDRFLADEQQREALRETVRNFVQKRQKALLRECEDAFATIIENIPKMSMQTAQALLVMMGKQMSAIATQVEGVFQRSAA